MVITTGTDDAPELDSWTKPAGTSSCDRDRSPSFMVNIYTRNRFGTFSHQATTDICSEGHESRQGAENARASCGKGEERSEVSASACWYWFVVIGTLAQSLWRQVGAPSGDQSTPEAGVRANPSVLEYVHRNHRN